MPTHALVNNGTPDIIMPVYQHKTVLTDDQIKALPTTAVELLPAPTDGKMLLPISLVLVTNFTAGAYTADPNGYIEFLVGGFNIISTLPNDSANSLVELTRFLTSNKLYYLTTQNAYNPALTTNWDSTYFRTTIRPNYSFTVVIDNNGAGDLTGGNAANTLIITTNYILVDVS